MPKKKTIKNKIIQKPIPFFITDNCTVKLNDPNSSTTKEIRISTVNGYDRYIYLIGKKRGDKVNVDNSTWIIGYVTPDKKKKYYHRRKSLMSHPLNNSTHFFK